MFSATFIQKKSWQVWLSTSISSDSESHLQISNLCMRQLRAIPGWLSSSFLHPAFVLKPKSDRATESSGTPQTRQKMEMDTSETIPRETWVLIPVVESTAKHEVLPEHRAKILSASTVAWAVRTGQWLQVFSWLGWACLPQCHAVTTCWRAPSEAPEWGIWLPHPTEQGWRPASMLGVSTANINGWNKRLPLKSVCVLENDLTALMRKGDPLSPLFTALFPPGLFHRRESTDISPLHPSNKPKY